MIKTYIYNELGERVNTIEWLDDNNAKAFMFDAMLDENYDCYYYGEPFTTKNGMCSVYAIIPRDY